MFSIHHLAQLFDCTVGLSNPTMGIGASVAAVALGVRVIEKHFTLRRANGGVDFVFSLEPEELKSLVIESERAFLALGQVQYGIQKGEEKSVFFKRYIYVAKDVKAGEVVTKENIRIIRPGDGLAPKHYEQILNKKASEDLNTGTALRWDYVG